MKNLLLKNNKFQSFKNIYIKTEKNNKINNDLKFNLKIKFQ